MFYRTLDLRGWGSLSLNVISSLHCAVAVRTPRWAMRLAPGRFGRRLFYRTLDLRVWGSLSLNVISPLNCAVAVTTLRWAVRVLLLTGSVGVCSAPYLSLGNGFSNALSSNVESLTCGHVTHTSMIMQHVSQRAPDPYRQCSEFLYREAWSDPMELEWHANRWIISGLSSNVKSSW
jgi:hypothetical protein